MGGATRPWTSCSATTGVAAQTTVQAQKLRPCGRAGPAAPRSKGRDEDDAAASWTLPGCKAAEEGPW